MEVWFWCCGLFELFFGAGEEKVGVDNVGAARSRGFGAGEVV